ncbi:haloalkane dehalogenase [Longispora albida]|uniref:haloalkane dehalogenase n=1 Tax=Longispora albida TaxID=203523 RepID=UPI000367C60A|nr:haloalkane dehalogenase [Longispora albida]
MPVIDVLGSTIHYIDVPGSDPAAPPVVFLHGNPSSSHTWRNVLPAVTGGARLLAPDLIGMGGSGKPEIEYSFADHAAYLDAWFDALGLTEVVLVGHDWGGALAFDFAARHPGRVKGIAFFEAVLRSTLLSELAEGPRARTELLRSEKGAELALGSNFLIETAYTKGVLNALDPETLAPYLAPYATPESRRPLLRWARSIPVDGDPADVQERLTAFQKWAAGSPEVPKLLLTFDGSPILMITEQAAAWCAENLAGLETEYAGRASHHATEDQPAAIGAAISRWLDRTGLLN